MIKSKKFIAIILVFAFVFGVFLINEFLKKQRSDNDDRP